MAGTLLRRGFVLVALLGMVKAWALTLADLSSQEAAGGLKEVWQQGAVKAIDLLGRPDGFLANAQVRIPLPEGLRKAEGLLRGLGMSKEVDALIVAMNRAAEAAVPEAKALVVKAVKEMTVEDAKAILTGGDDAATQYFKGKTKASLTEKFLPIVRRAVEKVRLTQTYEKFAGRAAAFGLIRKEDATLDRYVAERALDGLYRMMAEQERAIRQDPAQAMGKLAQKAFGLLQ